MKYIDDYKKIEKLKKELKILKNVYYNYENRLPDKKFYKVGNEIKEIKNKISFLENMRRANEKIKNK